MFRWESELKAHHKLFCSSERPAGKDTRHIFRGNKPGPKPKKFREDMVPYRRPGPARYLEKGKPSTEASPEKEREVKREVKSEVKVKEKGKVKEKIRYTLNNSHTQKN